MSTSSKTILRDTGVEGRASSLKTDTDEPARRRRQSKSKRAKKAAKVKGRGQSPRSSHAQLEDYGVEDFQDLIPDDLLRATITRMGHLNRGYKYTSESARSAASRMLTLMTEMGEEHQKLEKAREAEKELLQEENKLLKQTIGLIRRDPRTRRSQPPSEPRPPVEPEFESLDDVPDEDTLEEAPSEAGSDQR